METRAQQLLAALQRGPMKQVDAYEILRSRGAKTFIAMLKSGVIETYTDENPSYAGGGRGQKPMCQWVKLTGKEYPTPTPAKSIAKAIALLEKYGYTVTGPNAHELTSAAGVGVE